MSKKTHYAKIKGAPYVNYYVGGHHLTNKGYKGIDAETAGYLKGLKGFDVITANQYKKMIGEVTETTEDDTSKGKKDTKTKETKE